MYPASQALSAFSFYFSWLFAFQLKWCICCPCETRNCRITAPVVVSGCSMISPRPCGEFVQPYAACNTGLWSLLVFYLFILQPLVFQGLHQATIKSAPSNHPRPAPEKKQNNVQNKYYSYVQNSVQPSGFSRMARSGFSGMARCGSRDPLQIRRGGAR